MVRQARSEVTRRKIIDAAVDLFTDSGYGTTGLGDIIDRVGVTKGALYYHFDSKESLARAIIADGGAALGDAFAGISSTPAPALENMIHGVFVVASLVRTDKLAATAVHLSRALGEFTEAAAGAYGLWVQTLAAQAIQAQQQGDVRDDVDTAAIAEVILAALLGVELMSHAASGGTDLIPRLTRAWEVLLPTIATDQALPYFREYLGRESMRHLAPAITVDEPAGR
ncbi:MAG TPA: ScbR family autoregulator-binding transcription factor [Mycobacterium sp.]|nr:ScbR family autoregulator-binding transcription factor [Mycobacterium sp.]